MKDIVDTETTAYQYQLFSNITVAVLNSVSTYNEYFSGENLFNDIFSRI